jgi:hypothetical protein
VSKSRTGGWLLPVSADGGHLTCTGVGRAMKLLFEASAIGELAVGIAVVLFPRTVGGLLFGVPIDGIGAVIARLAGIAITALGLTWWLASGDLQQRLTAAAPGFFGYNLGAGLLFLSYAMAATVNVPVAWLAAAVHLLVGVAFCAALLLEQRSRQIPAAH